MERALDSEGLLKGAVHVVKTLNDMREHGELCDLVFEVSNTQFSVHRLVVAVWSPVLKNLLGQATFTQRLRIVYDKTDVFEQFIGFLYTGMITDHVINICAVLLLASTFQINLLREQCQDLLKANTTLDSVIGHYHTALRFQLNDLEIYCVEFLKQHLAEVAQKSELRELTPTQINSFLGSAQISNLDPEMKLFLIISWLTEDVPDRQRYLVLLLGHIDWSVVAKDFLEEISQTDNFFTSNPSSLYLLLQTLHSSSIPLGPYKYHFEPLREQYNYLLGSVVGSSGSLGTGQPERFQPVHFSLVSRPLEERDNPKPLKNCDSSGFSKNAKETLEESVANITDSVSETEPLDNEFSYESSCSLENFSTTKSKVSTRSKQKHEKNTHRLPAKNKSDEKYPGDDVKDIKVPETAIKDITKRKRLRQCKKTIDSKVDKTNSNSSAKKQKTSPTGSSTRVQRHSGKDVKEENTAFNPQSLEQFKRERPVRVASQRKAAEKNSEQQLRTSSKRQSKDDKPTEVCSKTVVKDEAVSAEEGEGDVAAKQEMEAQEEIPSKKKVARPGRKKAVKKNVMSKKLGGSKSIKKTVTKSSTVKLKTVSKSDMLQCSECEYTTSNNNVLERHIKQVHQSNSLFCCGLCSFKAKCNKDYYEHLKETHFPGPPFKCDDEECSYVTDKFQDLLTHRRHHTDHRPFVCDVCLAAFRSRNNLHAHFKIHSDEKKFECPECGRCFKLNNTLQQHLVTHSDLRPYLCDMCGFSTKFQSHLISHKRIHSGEVYRCNFPSCTYSTPKRSQLKSHMRSHLGIRRHVCSTCGKAFIEKSHLVRHERIHSMEKTHACSECDYASTRADKLRDHYQKHHSEEALKSKAAAVAKKTEAAAKGKKKPKAPKDLPVSVNVSDHLLPPSNQDSLIEVVVVKKDTGNYPKTNATVTVSDIGTTQTDDISNFMSGFQFQPLQNDQRQGTEIIISSPHALPVLDQAPSNLSQATAVMKNEKEINTVEILTKMGLTLADVNSAGEPIFGFRSPGQMLNLNTPVGEGTGDITLLDNRMANFDMQDTKALVTQQTNQHYHHEQSNLLHSNHNLVPVEASSYSSSSQFSLPAQPLINPQQSYELQNFPHPLIMVPNVRSSDATQQYYLQQQQHASQHQTSQNQEEQVSGYSHVNDYLY